MQTGEHQIDHQDVRFFVADQIEGSESIRSFASELEIDGLLENETQSLANNAMIVCEADVDGSAGYGFSAGAEVMVSGKSAVRQAPFPGSDSMINSPPSNAARSVMPLRPAVLMPFSLAVASNPGPESWI
jgi:hypothetical protein